MDNDHEILNGNMSNYRRQMEFSIVVLNNL